MLRSLAVDKKSLQLYKIGFSFSFLDLQLTNVLFFSQLLFSTLEAFFIYLREGWGELFLDPLLSPQEAGAEATSLN